jgi:hypothetical protein
MLTSARGDFRTVLSHLDRHTRIDDTARAPLWDVAHQDHTRQVAAATQLLQCCASTLEATRHGLDVSDAVERLARQGRGRTVVRMTDGLDPVFDVDILGTSENWQSYANCAGTWGAVGDFCTTVADRLRRENVASVSSRARSERLSATLDSFGDAFRALRGHYSGIAADVHAFAHVAQRAFVRMRTLAATATAAGTAAAAAHVSQLVAECDALVTHHEKAVESVATAVHTGGALLPRLARELGGRL